MISKLILLALVAGVQCSKHLHFPDSAHPSCANTRCSPGQSCVMVGEAPCFRAPCKQPTCISNTDVCSQPKAVGPCRAAMKRWYFDSTSHTCKMFKYGGCGGNDNRFGSLEKCTSVCLPGGVMKPIKLEVPAAPVEKKDVCSQPRVIGHCRAALKRWFFDSASHTCKTFSYGGCGGNDNRFDSMEECEMRCQPGETNVPIKPEMPRPRIRPDIKVDICLQPKVVGPCRAAMKSWYFDSTSHTCKTFFYGGCGGNKNRFDSVEECEMFCLSGGSKTPTPIKPEIPEPPIKDIEVDFCLQPKAAGPCRAAMKSWYFDSTTHTCKTFFYGGCGGNKNRFDSVEECEMFCLSGGLKTPTPIKPEIPEPPALDIEVDFCLQPKVVGPCRAAMKSWYFDSTSHTCKTFMYGGCGGNKNRFDSVEECEMFCLSGGLQKPTKPELPGPPVKTTKDRCSQSKVSGPCMAFMPSWHFDPASRTCQMFIYGGCGGNDNRFGSVEECNKVCGGKVVNPPTSSPPDRPPQVAPSGEPFMPTNFICLEPKDKGTGKGKSVRWYFDIEKKKCRKFVYKGRGGNSNRFSSKEVCKKTCGHPVHPLPISLSSSEMPLWN